MQAGCQNIMNRLKGTVAPSADQQNLLRACENALRGMP